MEPDGSHVVDPLRHGIDTVEEEIKDIIHAGVEVASDFIEEVKGMLGNKGKGNETEEANVTAQVNTPNEQSSDNDDESVDVLIQRRLIQLYI